MICFCGIGDIADLAEKFATTLGILGGGLWALYKYETYERRILKAESMPQIIVGVETAALGKEAKSRKTRISVRATIQNVGKVHAEIDMDPEKSFFAVEKFKPGSDKVQSSTSFDMDIPDIILVRPNTSQTVCGSGCLDPGAYRITAQFEMTKENQGEFKEICKKYGVILKDDSSIVWSGSNIIQI